MNRIRRNALILLTAACTPLVVQGARTLPPRVPALDPFDTAFFSAVVRAARDGARSGVPAAFAVDPRPLNPDSSVAVASAQTRLAVTPEQLRARVTVLRQLGVAEADEDIPPNCATVMMPPTTNPDLKQGCPKTLQLIISVSVAKPSAFVPPDGPAPLAVASARVPELGIGPFGWSIEAIDYVMAKYPDGWHFLHRTAVLVIE